MSKLIKPATIVLIALCILSILFTIGCANNDTGKKDSISDAKTSDQQATDVKDKSDVKPVEGSSDEKASESSSDEYKPQLYPSEFSRIVDNAFFPIKQGMMYVYKSGTEGDMKTIEETSTGETKVVMGVTCTIVHVVEKYNGQIIEETFDWYAQDSDRNVWYFGEDSKEYENGVVKSTSGSWEAGVDGARPGIVMMADPRPGEIYRSEYYPGEAEDMAEVISKDETVTVPYGVFPNCLKVRDYSPLEPGKSEFKYYAEGVGMVLETEGDVRVELVSVRPVDRM